MSDLENLERRVAEIERKLDVSLGRQAPPDADRDFDHPHGRRGRPARWFLGALILIVGLVWLGQGYDVEWLNRLRVWPLAVIAVGLLVILGDSRR